MLTDGDPDRDEEQEYLELVEDMSDDDEDEASNDDGAIANGDLDDGDSGGNAQDDLKQDWTEKKFIAFCEAGTRVRPAPGHLAKTANELRPGETIELVDNVLKVVGSADAAPAGGAASTDESFFQKGAGEIIDKCEGEEGAGAHLIKQRATYQFIKSLQFQLIRWVVACVTFTNVRVWNGFTNTNVEPRDRVGSGGGVEDDQWDDESYASDPAQTGAPSSKKRKLPSKTRATTRKHADRFSTPFINLRVIYALTEGVGKITFFYTQPIGRKQFSHTILIPSGYFLYAKRDLMEGYRSDSSSQWHCSMTDTGHR
jgi:hypothetical protein